MEEKAKNIGDLGEHSGSRSLGAPHIDIRLLAVGTLAMGILAACGSEPRLATLRVDSASRRASLVGATHAVSPAAELSAGCPGFLDPKRAEYRIEVDEHATIRVRSSEGPLVLAARGGQFVECDNDGGSGHRPSLRLTSAGSYDVYVGSLNASATELSFELDVEIEDADTEPERPDRLEISITSEPTGALVQRPNGEVLGVTPMMWTERDPSGSGQEFIVEWTDGQRATLRGVASEGVLALHAVLSGPGSLAEPATSERASEPTDDQSSSSPPRNPNHDYGRSPGRRPTPGDSRNPRTPPPVTNPPLPDRRTPPNPPSPWTSATGRSNNGR